MINGVMKTKKIPKTFMIFLLNFTSLQLLGSTSIFQKYLLFSVTLQMVSILQLV